MDGVDFARGVTKRQMVCLDLSDCSPTQARGVMSKYFGFMGHSLSRLVFENWLFLLLGSLLVAYVNLRDNEAPRFMDSEAGLGYSSVPEVRFQLFSCRDTCILPFFVKLKSNLDPWSSIGSQQRDFRRLWLRWPWQWLPFGGPSSSCWRGSSSDSSISYQFDARFAKYQIWEPLSRLGFQFEIFFSCRDTHFL